MKSNLVGVNLMDSFNGEQNSTTILRIHQKCPNQDGWKLKTNLYYKIQRNLILETSLKIVIKEKKYINKNKLQWHSLNFFKSYGPVSSNSKLIQTGQSVILVKYSKQCKLI